MSRVLTFSRQFPSYHPKAGQPTHFVEAIMNSIYPTMPAPKQAVRLYDNPNFATIGTKHHTIRAGHRWKVGDWFSPRVWSGKPYHSKQITIAPDMQVKKVWNFKTDGCDFYLNNDLVAYSSSPSEMFLSDVSRNDGLSEQDFLDWFQYPQKEFEGQILCWNENIEY